MQVVVDLTDQFCKAYLNDEYAALCRKLAEKLGRKRPSPLYTNSPNAWASGIVRTVGWVNFLHDRSQTPSMPLYDIDYCFRVSKTTGATKQAAIRKMFRIRQFDHEWTLPSRIDDNPLVWTLQVNGLPVDIREAPDSFRKWRSKKV